MDPTLYDEPTKFDGDRFLKRRQEDSTTAGQQSYIAANLSNMSWGYGSHACPGRWFADAEIKVIVIYMVQHFDMRFGDGYDRPKSMEFETQNLPDRSATVWLKRRNPVAA